MTDTHIDVGHGVMFLGVLATFLTMHIMHFDSVSADQSLFSLAGLITGSYLRGTTSGASK
jgi:hypothetical protein